MERVSAARLRVDGLLWRAFFFFERKSENPDVTLKRIALSLSL